jgi:hypothetical protein
VILQAAKGLEQPQIQVNPQEPKTAVLEQTAVAAALISAAATLAVEILASSLLQFFDYLLLF